MSSLHHELYDQKISELQYQVAAYEDHTAYRSLFFLLFPSLQNFAFSIVKSRVLAEEIASDMLLEVWIRRKKLMEIKNLKLYLFTGTKHAALGKLKQEGRISKFSLLDLQVEFISDYLNPEEYTELHELETEIAQAIKQLPPACQLIYKLAKEDRLKYKEIAQLLHLSIKTIDHQISIALKKIGQTLRFLPSKK